MMIQIFSGTSEGHALCRFLAAHHIPAEVFVATAYGEAVMEPLPEISIHTGRLSPEEMCMQIDSDALVIDATHPYAEQVTENIRAACKKRGAEYLRLVRPQQAANDVITVRDTAAAVEWLCCHPGNVLLTTGSKELEAYTAIPDYQARLYPRVLPTAEVLEKCAKLGFSGASIIAMQGPFSYEMNLALLKKVKASVLVTKDTGKNGGFLEKLSAARAIGAQVLMIARPRIETGFTLEELQHYLSKRLGLPDMAPPRFPVFVSLWGKKVVVAGAGTIAARRIDTLRKFGAEIHVIAPETSKDISLDGIIFEQRPFCSDDLQDAVLAVAATNIRAVNHEIAQVCQEKAIPVSVADCAAESTFYFPAICQGRGLIAGVISDGSDHHAVSEMAKQIRKIME